MNTMHPNKKLDRGYSDVGSVISSSKGSVIGKRANNKFNSKIKNYSPKQSVISGSRYSMMSRDASLVMDDDMETLFHKKVSKI